MAVARAFPSPTPPVASVAIRVLLPARPPCFAVPATAGVARLALRATEEAVAVAVVEPIRRRTVAVRMTRSAPRAEAALPAVMLAGARRAYASVVGRTAAVAAGVATPFSTVTVTCGLVAPLEAAHAQATAQRLPTAAFRSVIVARSSRHGVATTTRLAPARAEGRAAARGAAATIAGARRPALLVP